MSRRSAFVLFLFLVTIFPTGCSPNSTPAPGPATPALGSMAEAVATPSPAADPIPTSLPPTPTAEPSPTPLPPLSMGDFQFSGLGQLPRKNSYSPGTYVFAWVENAGAQPAGGLEVTFFSTLDGQSTPLGTDFLSSIYPGQKGFALYEYSGNLPEGAQLAAEVTSMFEPEFSASPITLAQTREYWVRFPEQPNFAILHGKLTNLSDQSGYLSELYALWYNEQEELIHISQVASGPRELPSNGSVPFAFELNFIHLASDSGAPLSDFARYELAYSAYPMNNFSTPFSFSYASLPFRYEGSEIVWALGEATNLTQEWRDLEAWFVFYDQDDRVIGLFPSSRLGTDVFAPGETRPFSSNLFYVATLRPSDEWIASVARTEVFYDYSAITDAELSLEVGPPTITPAGAGYELTFMVSNPHAVDISEVRFYFRLSQDPGGPPVVAFSGRVARGEMSDVIYSKPLAAGDSWPVTSYFELPAGVAPDSLEIKIVARGKP